MSFFDWLDPSPKRRRKKPPTPSKWQKRLHETILLRPRVKKEFVPLFDHCIELAKSAHRTGYYKQAGRDLRHARKVAAY